jgi:hypothetical protein
MDLYTFCLLLGGAGLGVMALGGLGHHGQSGASHSGSIHGHAHGPAHVAGTLRAGARTLRGGHHASHSPFARAMWSLMSPRVVFSILLGTGATGTLLGHMLGGGLLLGAALAGGLIFERALVTPIWNFASR